MQDEEGHRALLPGRRIRARGAETNASGRFERHAVEAVDDGWDMAEEERLVGTEVRLERPRSALSYNKSPDIPFDRSINPYRGCEHGCIYCFARPSIGAVLERELRAKSYKVATVAIGTNTDPYQPCERDHRVMREVVEVLSAFDHPLAITTKGTLIERDLDLLAPMAA